MLTELCAVFGFRSAGLRWPAEGAAVLLVETGPASPSPLRVSVPLTQQASGTLWADGTLGDLEFLRLAANALGRSEVIKTFLGPAADQARIAQRLEDAGKVAG